MLVEVIKGVKQGFRSVGDEKKCRLTVKKCLCYRLKSFININDFLDAIENCGPRR